MYVMCNGIGEIWPIVRKWLYLDFIECWFLKLTNNTYNNLKTEIYIFGFIQPF